MIRLGISEILDKASSFKTKRERAEFLKANDSPVLRDVLRMRFDKGLEWDLPEGMPPIKKNENPGQQGNLFASWRKLPIFLKGYNNDIPSIKRETLFVQFLEALDPKDAVLVCNLKDHKYTHPRLSKDVVEMAFPGLTGGNDG